MSKEKYQSPRESPCSLFWRAGQAIFRGQPCFFIPFIFLFHKSVLGEGTHLLCFVSLCISLLLWLQLQCLICNLSPIMIQSALMKAIESRIIVVTCRLVMLYRPRLTSWGLNSTTFTRMVIELNFHHVVVQNRMLLSILTLKENQKMASYHSSAL